MKPSRRNHLLQIALIVLLIALFASPPLQAQDLSDYDIYIYNTKRDRVRQATDLPGVGEFNPSFSPSGHAIVHDVVDFDNGIHDIWITNLRRSRSRPLQGAEGGNDASWSPQGPLIAFDRNNEYDQDPNLYYVRIGYSTRHLIRENAIDPDWAPNGRRVVFKDNVDGSIRTIQIYTGNESVIEGSNAYSNPVWSPNGDWIAFADGKNIFKIAVANRGIPVGAVMQVTNDQDRVYNFQPSWSPDSKEIYFSSVEFDIDWNELGTDIMKVSAAGGDPVFVTGLPNHPDYDPAASSSCWSTKIAYAGFTEPTPAPAPLAANDDYILDQNYPNPFTTETEISFEVPIKSWVKLYIYGEDGVLVKRLVDRECEGGNHKAVWNGLNEYGAITGKGMFFYTLSSGDFKETKTIYKNN